MVKTTLIQPLHGLRGMAAFTVLGGHSTSIPTAPSLGVVLFFLLSGFLMGRLYLEREFKFSEVKSYALARVARVYPLFALIIVLAGSISVFSTVSPFNLRPGDILPHLLLFGDGATVWTISVEFQFYAVFILVWFLYGKLPMPNAWLVGSVAAFAILAVVFADAGRINLVRYLHLFTGGLVLSVMLRRPASVTVREAAAICFPILLAGYGAAFFLVPHFYQHDLVYSDLITSALCAALIYVTVAAPNCWVAKLLSLPPAVWAGEISFGVYLIHRPVQWAIDQLLPDWSGVRVFPLLFFATILLASLAFLYYERPARRILRKAGESFRFTWQLRRAETR